MFLTKSLIVYLVYSVYAAVVTRCSNMGAYFILFCLTDKHSQVQVHIAGRCIYFFPCILSFFNSTFNVKS